ncbi:MAG: hypothetical protein KC469_01465 [Flavobacteriaceae bacterium]|nr:hypothetical protein [Flavobacteriaceae bacterium]
MSKKRSKTSNFSLDLKKKTGGKLPSKEEVEKTISKVSGEEILQKKIKPKRIPFTTAITPEQRATLEAATHEGDESIADLLANALDYYFQQVRPLGDENMKDVFLKIFEKKLK